MTHRNPRSLSDGRRFALVSDEHVEAFSFDWFDPSHWGDQAEPVSLGGRGAAWFVDSAQSRWVLRKYYRGGLPGRFIKKTYVFLGRARVRSIREYLLLQTLREQGLPVPEPVAALYETKGLTYTAAIIIRRIENVRALHNFQSREHTAVWQAAGVTIRRFHDQGVFHADLNCTNILVEAGTHSIYLIDFDRGRVHSDQRLEAPWKQANLDRLARSVRKMITAESTAVRETLLQALLEGYRTRYASAP